jgi:ATP synthase F0 subunit c
MLHGERYSKQKWEVIENEKKKDVDLRPDLGIEPDLCVLGQGIAISKGLEGIARNPEAQPKIFIPMIVGLALIESLVIYALVISILLYAKL